MSFQHRMFKTNSHTLCKTYPLSFYYCIVLWTNRYSHLDNLVPEVCLVASISII